MCPSRSLRGKRVSMQGNQGGHPHTYNEEHVLLPAYCCTIGHPDDDPREAVGYRGGGEQSGVQRGGGSYNRVLILPHIGISSP